MILASFIKQPAETLDYDISFSEFLADGDTLVGAGDPAVPDPLDVAVSPEGLTLGPTFLIDEGRTIKQWIAGGVSGTRYKITLTVTSNAGRVEQIYFVFRVKDY